MRWRFLKDEELRIPYTEIAEHVAAIFFPGQKELAASLKKHRFLGKINGNITTKYGQTYGTNVPPF